MNNVEDIIQTRKVLLEKAPLIVRISTSKIEHPNSVWYKAKNNLLIVRPFSKYDIQEALVRGESEEEMKEYKPEDYFKVIEIIGKVAPALAHFIKYSGFVLISKNYVKRVSY